MWVAPFMWYKGIPWASPSEYHYTTLRVQYPYTLENHSSTITCETVLYSEQQLRVLILPVEIYRYFIGALSVVDSLVTAVQSRPASQNGIYLPILTRQCMLPPSTRDCCLCIQSYYICMYACVCMFPNKLYLP